MLRTRIAQRGQVHVDLLNAFQQLIERTFGMCED
jgi:hypothetical protein